MGASPSTALQSFQSELCTACRNGHLDQVKQLITNWKRHATPGQKFDFGSALHESSDCGHFPIAEFLLIEGAEVDALNRDRRTPLQCAVSAGKDYVASLLVCHGALSPSSSRTTPLMLASARGDCSFVRDRISSGSDVNKKDENQQTALHYACKGRSVEAVELLLNAGAHVDVQDRWKSTLLILAVELAVNNGAFEIMRLLLKSENLGSAVNRTDDIGQSALHFACEGSSTEAVELLLNAGAHVYVQDCYTTPLISAVRNSAFDIMRLLLKSKNLGSAVNWANSRGETALHDAAWTLAESDSTEAFKLLLTAGASVDVQAEGYAEATPLILATLKGSSEAAKQLILHGADVNKKNNDLYTALHFAAKNNLIETGVLLVKAGADVYFKNRNGQSALDLAKPAFKDAVTEAMSFQTKKAISSCAAKIIPSQEVVKSTGSVESETVDTLPDTPIVKLETTPIAGRETTEQRLDKCRDNFISDPSCQSVLQPSKVDDIIPSGPVYFEVEALQTLPVQKDLRRIADNCGDNGEKLLTFLGLKLTEIQGCRKDANTSSDAFFQGLVIWQGENADDSDPVNWSTLLTAMKEAGMAGDARGWRQKIVERCAASLDKPRDAGQSGNDETPTPGQEEPI